MKNDDDEDEEEKKKRRTKSISQDDIIGESRSTKFVKKIRFLALIRIK